MNPKELRRPNAPRRWRPERADQRYCGGWRGKEVGGWRPLSSNSEPPQIQVQRDGAAEPFNSFVAVTRRRYELRLRQECACDE
jgi:hypothetical protein